MKRKSWSAFPSCSVLVLAAAACLAAPFAARADDASAIAIEERLLRQIFSDTRDGRLIATVLRQSGETDLAPLFAKLAAVTEKDRQVEANVSVTLLTKDPSSLDIDHLLKATDMNMSGAALAALIEAGAISNEQLQKVLNEAPDDAQRVLAASELNHRHALQDRKTLVSLAENRKDVVRYYAAVTLLDSKDQAENAQGLAVLQELTAKADPRHAPVQSLMLLRVRKEKITTALPWVESLARNKGDDSIRLMAVSTLLALQSPVGADVFKQVASESKETLPLVKLGLIAIEHGDQLKPDSIAPLDAVKSSLVKNVTAVARQSIAGADITPDLLKLVKDGQPIILDWALLYADRTEGPRKISLLEALVRQAAIVDQRREQDYERAALAAQKLAEDGGPAGRQILASTLKSDNLGIVEATLLGLARSSPRDLSELILPLWTPAFYKKSSNEAAANIAALILGREGRADAQAYLQGMTQAAENVGYRALAGWYYAKLTKQSTELVKRVIADPK